MKILDTFRSAIGPPQVLREIRDGPRLVAAVGRWQHDGTRVDYGSDGAALLVFNVSGGQRVERRNCDRSIMGVMRAGSIGTVLPHDPTSIAVVGKADAVGIFVSRELLEAVAGSGRFAGVRHAAGLERDLQAAGARALVALARDDDESRVELQRIACDVASVFGSPVVPKREMRPRLCAASLRRVQALVDERLDGDAVSMPSISELAEAAGLSRYHFIRTFHGSEGLTPYAWVAGCRLERSLALILKGDTRIDDIGERLGFSSPSHFVGSFRGRFGVTPGSLRDAAFSA